MTVNLSSGLAVGSYTLKLFSEQYNGDKMTDYASNFADVALTVGYSVAITTTGADITKTTSSGAASQIVTSDNAMTPVVYTADDGYYFPTDYASLSTTTGITVVWDSYAQITISGTPTANTAITLVSATAKSQEEKPTGPTVTGCTTASNNDGAITGLDSSEKYEYKTTGAYTEVPDNATEITGLAPDTLASADSDALTVAAYVPSEQVAAPEFSPAAGEVAAGTLVAISCVTPDATIYYTTDGSEPTRSSQVCNGVYTVNADTTIKAFAVKDGMTDSIIAMAAYTVTTQNVYTVTYDPNGATDGAVPVDANTYAANAQVTVFGNTGNLVRDGYTFNNWNTQADGSGTPYKAGNTFAISADTMLYVQWKVEQQQPQPAPIDYSGGGGSYMPAPTPEVITVPVSGEDESVNVKVEVKNDTATIKAADIDKVLGVEYMDTVNIDVSGLKSSVSEVVIPGKNFSLWSIIE